MSALSGDYTSCSILIYDEAGNHLGNTKVMSYNMNTLRIEVEEPPRELSIGSVCRMLILSLPSPCEYEGRVTKEGARITIALFHGHEKENRTDKRYKINAPALIENLICDGRPYKLHTPLNITLLNISRSGMRFRAPYNSLSDGDRFQLRIKINDNEKLIIADVVNHLDNEHETSDYGCVFLIAATKGEGTGRG